MRYSFSLVLVVLEFAPLDSDLLDSHDFRLALDPRSPFPVLWQLSVDKPAAWTGRDVAHINPPAAHPRERQKSLFGLASPSLPGWTLIAGRPGRLPWTGGSGGFGCRGAM